MDIAVGEAARERLCPLWSDAVTRHPVATQEGAGELRIKSSPAHPQAPASHLHCLNPTENQWARNLFHRGQPSGAGNRWTYRGK